MSLEIKCPTVTRYARVQKVLLSDNALSKKLSTKTSAVCRVDKSFVDFPVEVIHVTDEIHRQGMDSNSLSRTDIIRFGVRLLLQGKVPDNITSLAAVETSVALKDEDEKPKPIKPPKPPKLPKVKPPKLSKVKPPKPPKLPKVKPPKPELACVVKVKAVNPEKVAAPPAAPAVKASTETKPEKAPVFFVRPHVPYVVGTAALSNLWAVLTLFEPFVLEGDAEAREVSQRVNDLIDDIHRRTILPSAEKDS